MVPLNTCGERGDLCAGGGDSLQGVIYFGTTSASAREALESLHADGLELDALRIRAFPFNDEVRDFMDTKARTILEDTDLLSIAQIFMNTSHRRLPVLRDGKLVGQVSRRDVLAAAHRMLEIAPEPKKAPLYLSSIKRGGDLLF